LELGVGPKSKVVDLEKLSNFCFWRNLSFNMEFEEFYRRKKEELLE
jgi:hypothetical protein